MSDLFIKALSETIVMVSGATVFSIIIGIPLALILWVTCPHRGLRPCKALHYGLGFFINALRSAPYIILIVLLMPITKYLVGTSIGSSAALVSLSLAGILMMARAAYDVFVTIPGGLIEVGVAFGASTRHILQTILLKEATPGLVTAITSVVISLVGFSAMAGAVGGGGLGDLAIRYGYQRYDMALMLTILAVLIVCVQAIQWAGEKISRSLTHGV